MDAPLKENSVYNYPTFEPLTVILIALQLNSRDLKNYYTLNPWSYKVKINFVYKTYFFVTSKQSEPCIKFFFGDPLQRAIYFISTLLKYCSTLFIYLIFQHNLPLSLRIYPIFLQLLYSISKEFFGLKCDYICTTIFTS